MNMKVEIDGLKITQRSLKWRRIFSPITSYFFLHLFYSAQFSCKNSQKNFGPIVIKAHRKYGVFFLILPNLNVNLVFNNGK